MDTIPFRPGEQQGPSTSSPHPILPGETAQPSQPLSSPVLPFDQSNVHPNQSHWSALADIAPQYTAQPVYQPQKVTDFSIERANQEPWRL